MKIIVDENLHDVDFLKGFTDSRHPRPHGYLAVPGSARRGGRLPVPGLLKSYSGRVQSLTLEQVQRLGG